MQNPEIDQLKDTKLIFVNSSLELTKVMTEDNESIVIVDALWLSFASFCAQSLFATYPIGRSAEIDEQKMPVSTHFDMRCHDISRYS